MAGITKRMVVKMTRNVKAVQVIYGFVIESY